MKVKSFTRKKLLHALAVIGMGLGSSNALAVCDSCMQSAVQAANTSLSTGMQSVNSSLTSHETAINQLNSTLQTSYQTMNQTYEQFNQKLIEVIEMMGSNSALEIDKTTKTVEIAGDSISLALFDALKQVNTVQTIIKQQEDYGELSHPQSIQIGTNKSVSLFAASKRKDGLKNLFGVGFSEYLGNTEIEEEGNRANAMGQLADLEDIDWDITPLLNNQQIVNELSDDPDNPSEMTRLMKLMQRLLVPIPLRVATEEELAGENASGFQDYEVSRRIFNAKTEVVYAALSDSLIDRVALMPIKEGDSQWNLGYQKDLLQPIEYSWPAADDEGNPIDSPKQKMVSTQAELKAEMTGRLMDEAWFSGISAMNQTGIQREIVYQQALNNKMLLKLIDEEEKKIMLLALKASNDLATIKPQKPE